MAIEPWGVLPAPPQPPQPPHPYWARAVPPDTSKIKANPRGSRIQRSIVNLLAAEHDRRPVYMKKVRRKRSQLSPNRARPSPIIHSAHQSRKVEREGALVL